MSGVTAANDDDPAQVLSSLADDLSNYWRDMRMSLELQKRHPDLFAKPALDRDPETSENIPASEYKAFGGRQERASSTGPRRGGVYNIRTPPFVV